MVQFDQLGVQRELQERLCYRRVCEEYAESLELPYASVWEEFELGAVVYLIKFVFNISSSEDQGKCLEVEHLLAELRLLALVLFEELVGNGLEQVLHWDRYFFKAQLAAHVDNS